ncbi:MAG: ABC transporter permease [Candidatus Dactylopiibacterium carminicum]|uniref:ABC transporter permease n=1 Tax=Candidatus Dactylopiibacterium carminicum TaxID=857335 RepID=A0A272EVP2_9RHOO|nr:ABC transporter permease [Candidatus Dactylopiibacterium carminicum]KAF7599889.1 ABC transporter permease [Candidatus Dactylopiibacterium carminicum]PAS94172.1 MAG: ABC transporter permease [Candidatus Dactylopiibacterium carminicum]PAS99890.1 MAG: ABC transporter permease [Candidatus Dactylopiibacterium carminicum]
MNWLASLREQRDRLWVPVLLIVAWEIFSRSGWLPPSLLPAPSTVCRTWADWVFSIDESSQANAGRWIHDALASSVRVFVGYAIAVVSGVLLGVAIGWWRWVEKTIEPTIQMLRPVPPVSWIPLAIIWFGIANKPAIFLVFLGAFFPVLMNAIHGVKTVDRNLIRAAAMMGGREAQILRYVVLPAALPSIFAGLRIAIGSAWMLTVTAEMVAVKSGLGYVLWDSYYFLRYDLVIAAMISIGLLGFLTDWLIKLLMSRILHWQHGQTVQGRNH